MTILDFVGLPRSKNLLQKREFMLCRILQQSVRRNGWMQDRKNRLPSSVLRICRKSIQRDETRTEKSVSLDQGQRRLSRLQDNTKLMVQYMRYFV